MYRLRRLIVKYEVFRSIKRKSRFELFMEGISQWFIVINPKILLMICEDVWFTLERGALLVCLMIVLTYLCCAFFLLIDLLKLFLWAKNKMT